MQFYLFVTATRAIVFLQKLALRHLRSRVPNCLCGTRGYLPSLIVVYAGLVFPVLGSDIQTIQRGATIDPPSLDPNIGTATPASPVLSDLVEGLVVRGRAGEPVPGAAVSWSLSDDLLTYRFELREQLKWSDGQPLTAQDFVYSFRRLLNPATAAPGAGMFRIIDGAAAVLAGEAPAESLRVAAIDALTLEIRLARPAPYFIQLLANSQGTPVPRHAIEKHGRNWTRPGLMVTSGPYVLTERVPQVHMRLERNPHYHAADKLSIDVVYWRPVQDLGAAFRQFRAGELHTILLAPPDQLQWLRDNMPNALHVNPIQANYHLVFNLSRAPVDDPRVRRALYLAIDHDAIANAVMQGGARPAPTLITPGIGGYPGLELPAMRRSFAVRQDQARQLLAEAGYGPDVPLRVPLIYDTQEENRKVMVAITAMWRAIGVVTQVENLEGRALIGRLRGRDFVVARSGQFAVFDDAYAFLQRYRSDSTDNYAAYRNPNYDELLDQANAERDAAKRIELLLSAERMLLGDQPILPIYWYLSKVLVSPRVQGWQDAPLGTPPTRYLSLK